jgi:DNA-binding transcriptional MocR family regulator
MHMHPTSQSINPLPDFERPSEAVVFWTLENLCAGAGGRFMLPLPKLARHVRLSLGTTKRAVASLSKRGLIRYRRGFNQFRPTIFELPPAYTEVMGDKSRGEELSQEATAGSKIARPNPSDKSGITKDISIGDINDGEVVHREAMERLAYRIADGLGDMKNLALYRSYCRRFPAGVVLKAFVRAKEPTPDKIRVSRGALFNFLVQLYAKHGDK